MRELICTVSGQSAETQSNTIRITNDRNNLPNSGAEGFVLPDSGFGRVGSVRPSPGLREPTGHDAGEAGGISPEAGDDWEAPSSNGRDRRVTYPEGVYLVSIALALVVSAISYYLPILIGKVSHLSGFWWLVGGVAAFLIACTAISFILWIAAVSDERIAQGGSR